MRKMLFSVCVALAVLGCGGDDGNLPPCPAPTCIDVYSKCGEWAYDPSTEFCSEGSVYPKCGGYDYYEDPSTKFCSRNFLYLKCGGKDYDPSKQYCSNGTLKTYYGFLTDSRDGQTYKVSVIGSQTWFAENLNYNALGSKCSNSDSNCVIYGRLYNWSTAMGLNVSYNSSLWDGSDVKHRGICPDGWHIPNDDDWDVLMDYVGGSSVAGKKLRVTAWRDGTDEYGFSALPGGGGVGGGDWWSASEYKGSRSDYAHRWSMGYDSESAYWTDGNYKSYLYSVRCLQDGDEKPSTFVSCANQGTSDSSVTCSGQTYKTVVIGDQTWMAENLNYNASGSKCHSYNSANCDKYGRLYNWSTAMGLPSSCNSSSCASQIQSLHQGICPSGWHIPGEYDWNVLMDYIGGDYSAETKLWKNGTDEYGFSALPGGYGYSDGNFDRIGYGGYLWSASEYDSDDAYCHMNCGYFSKSDLFYVRCIQNNYKKYYSKGNNINNYKTVVIGTQKWMAENLDYAVEGSKCYSNDPAYCDKYGRLYDWSTAMGLPSSCNSSDCSNQIQLPHRGICPSGWHIPSNGDWDILVNYVGGSSVAETKLKATSGWYNSGNTDEYGFSALPGGYGDSSGSFDGVGSGGRWWSATEYNASDAYGRGMYYYYGSAYWDGNVESGLFSVRCVQD